MKNVNGIESSPLSRNFSRARVSRSISLLTLAGLRHDHEEKVVELSHNGDSQSAHVDGTAISSRRDDFASGCFEGFHGCIGVAHSQLQPRGAGILNPSGKRLSFDILEF